MTTRKTKAKAEAKAKGKDKVTAGRARVMQIFRGAVRSGLGWLVLGGAVHGVISAGVF
jgi:hypothetical protein